MSETPPPFFLRNYLRVVAILILIGEFLIRKISRIGQQAYIDSDAFPWTRQLEQNWQSIRTELDAILNEQQKIPAFHEISPEQEILGNDKNWKSYVFFVFGKPIDNNCSACPETTKQLKQIPGLCNAMFSILGPQRSIPEHRGPYKGLLRYQLALIVPEDRKKLSITVNGIERHWQEGKTLILDDSYPHSVQNNSDSLRVILFADFIRPLPWPLSWYNRFVVKLLSLTPLAKEPIARINQYK